MLSTKYRLRLICKSIAAGTEVGIEDMIWQRNWQGQTHHGLISVARRMATDEDGSCLKYLDIGDPRKSKRI